MSLLSDRLNRANTKGLTQMQIVKEASRQGERISQTTVSRYLSGLHPVPASRSALAALSKVLDIPMRELEQLGSLPEELGEFTLPPEAATLDSEERALVLSLISFLVSRKNPIMGQDDEKPLDENQMEYHIGAVTPDGTAFRPDIFQDHLYRWEKYGPAWRQSWYAIAARRNTEDIEDSYKDLPRYLGGPNV